MLEKIIIPSLPVLIKDLGVIHPTLYSSYKKRIGIYKCSCGVEFKSIVDDIKSGNTKSCGCYKKKRIHDANITHGLAKHPLYHIWDGMMQRINNHNATGYKYYGGRGIKVCDRWANIENFIKDMYPTYKKGLTIDRIDGNGNYEPNNCRWATKTVQARNTRVLRKDNTSGYRGVGYHKSAKRWRASVVINKKQKHLGYFDTSLEAAKAYDKYVIDNNLEHTINGVFI